MTSPAKRLLALPTAAALLIVAIVHLIDGPGSLEDTFYLGALELALAAIGVPLALVLIVQPARAVWIAIIAFMSFALALYIASRTIGLPDATDDVGNWGETLGVLNLAGEIAVIALASAGLWLTHSERS
jgi:hypothetical protein